MPRGNGTGPSGMGSMTGRGAGYCANNLQPGFMNGGGGRGQGRGMGLGLGRQNIAAQQNDNNSAESTTIVTMLKDVVSRLTKLETK